MKDTMQKPELFAKIQAMHEDGSAWENCNTGKPPDGIDWPCNPVYGRLVHEYYGFPDSWESHVIAMRSADRKQASLCDKPAQDGKGAYPRLSKAPWCSDLYPAAA